MMNAEGIQLGDELSNFKAFTSDFPADLKGEAMSNSDMIRTSHNSFARPEPFEMEERTATKVASLLLLTSSSHPPHSLCNV